MYRYPGLASTHADILSVDVDRISPYNITTTQNENERKEANPKGSICSPLVLLRLLALGGHVFP